jgi:hypothetical protein
MNPSHIHFQTTEATNLRLIGALEDYGAGLGSTTHLDNRTLFRRSVSVTKGGSWVIYNASRSLWFP